MYLQPVWKTVWILIRWLRQKTGDLDLLFSKNSRSGFSRTRIKYSRLLFLKVNETDAFTQLNYQNFDLNPLLIPQNNYYLSKLSEQNRTELFRSVKIICCTLKRTFIQRRFKPIFLLKTPLEDGSYSEEHPRIAVPRKDLQCLP